MNCQLRVRNSPPELGGVPARPSNSRKGRAGGVVPKLLLAGRSRGTTPSAPSSVASRRFIDGAATPPNSGGESARPSIYSHLLSTWNELAEDTSPVGAAESRHSFAPAELF